MSELADRFEFRVSWEPYLLRPDTPPEGMQKPANHADPNDPGVNKVKKAGQEVGIDFTYKSPVLPNTLKAHALLQLIKQKREEEAQNDAVEQLFDAYHIKGLGLDEAVLLDVAKQCGLDQNEAKVYISDDKVIEDIRVKAMSWREKGVTSVPLFFMNGHKVFAGAQDVAKFKSMLELASEDSD